MEKENNYKKWVILLNITNFTSTNKAKYKKDNYL